MSTARTSDSPSWGWLLLTSAWLIPVLFGRGGFAWIGFLVIGLTVRRTAWLVAAGVYAAAGIALAAVDWNGWGGLTGAALWTVAIIHGLVVNPSYLRAMWARRTASAAAATTASAGRRPRRRNRPTAPVPREAEPLVAAADAERSRLLADAPAPAGDAAPADPPVDVNTAGRRQLATLPGLTAAQARKAVAERDTRGGFSDLEEFANVLGLQPHEFARLRDRAYCSPRKRALSTQGRKLDI